MLLLVALLCRAAVATKPMLCENAAYWCLQAYQRMQLIIDFRAKAQSLPGMAVVDEQVANPKLTPNSKSLQDFWHTSPSEHWTLLIR